MDTSKKFQRAINDFLDGLGHAFAAPNGDYVQRKATSEKKTTVF
jgi:hypothetical protein